MCVAILELLGFLYSENLFFKGVVNACCVDNKETWGRIWGVVVPLWDIGGGGNK